VLEHRKEGKIPCNCSNCATVVGARHEQIPRGSGACSSRRQQQRPGARGERLVAGQDGTRAVEHDRSAHVD